MKITRLMLALSMLGCTLQAQGALHIVSVQWGQKGGSHCDATAFVAKWCEGKPSCQVYASELCAHPFKGWKEAIVTYTCDGRQYTDTYGETAQIALPAHDPRGGGYIPVCQAPPGPNPPTVQPPGQPGGGNPPPGNPPGQGGGVKPAGELVQNPHFHGNGSWTVVGGPSGWYKPSNGGGEVIFEGDGVRFRGTAGNNRYGVIQHLNKEVSACRSLTLSASVRNEMQTLSGTGWNGREAPIAVFVNYTDASGLLHEQLSENPNEVRNMFWNGFYYLEPSGNSLSQHGTRINRGSPMTYTVDLMRLNPKPKTIHFLGGEGGGWTPRDGKLHFLSLICE